VSEAEGEADVAACRCVAGTVGGEGAAAAEAERRDGEARRRSGRRRRVSVAARAGAVGRGRGAMGGGVASRVSEEGAARRIWWEWIGGERGGRRGAEERKWRVRGGGAGMSWCEAESELDAWFGFSLPGCSFRCELGGRSEVSHMVAALQVQPASSPARDRDTPNTQQHRHTQHRSV